MKMNLALLFILVASVATAQHGHKKRPPPPTPPPVTSISQNAAAWTFETDANSPNVPLHPTALPGGIGWTIPIPRSPGDVDPCPGWYPQCVWLGYFTTPSTVPLLVGHSISATFEVQASSGSTYISYQTESGNTCAGTAQVRLYFSVKNENDSVETDRWWYDPQAFPLVPSGGPITITAMIDPASWSDVYGHHGSDPGYGSAFAAALKNVGLVGGTAGGGCFFGHGVFAVGGTANLIMHGFNAN